MSPSEARDHLEMADRIVAASVRDLSMRYSAPFFVVWGLFAGSVPLLFDLDRHRLIPDAALWLEPVLLAAGVTFSCIYGSSLRSKGYLSFLQREFLSVLWVTLAIAMAATLLGSRLFPEFALGGVWTLQASTVLFYIGLHSNLRALLGGAILMLSLVAANFFPAIAGYLLAAGFFVGYAGFGVAEMTATD